MKPILIAALATMIVTGMGLPVAAENWPAWRGDGNGISSDADLPEQWSADSNIAWKTAIEGEGISSPVVWDDTIFLTTANQGTSAAVSHAVVYSLGGGLLLVALLALFSLLRGSREGEGDRPDSTVLRLVYGLDHLATFLALTLFVLGLVAIIVRPELVTSGSINRGWLMSGLLGMTGLIGAFGLRRPGSAWRAIGALVMTLAAIGYIVAVPETRGANPIEMKELLVVSGPLIVAAVWNLLVFLLARRGSASTASSVASGVAFLALLALAVLQFSFLNYMRPRIEFQRSVVALDRTTGEILWQKPVFTAARGQKYITNSYATPTPVTDGESVIADFGLGIASLDFDGNIQWTLEEDEYYDWVRYGASESPVMFDDMVIYSFFPEYQGSEVGFGYSVNAHVTAVDKATGETRWSIVPPGGRDAYNTPLLVKVGDRDAVVMLTNKLVIALDARTGEEIWRCDVPITQGVPSLVADERRVFAIGGTHGPKGAVAIRLRGRGNVTKRNKLWQVTQGIPDVPSPILYDGLIYMVTDSGILTVLDADDGKRVWRKRLPGQYQASPVAGDGKIYITSVEGTTTVIRPGREYQEVAVNSLGEETLASPAISQGQILMRTKEHLYAIGAP